MNGIDFYDFLRRTYSKNGQLLYSNFTFCDWLHKDKNGTFSFRFNIPDNEPKAIPKDIIISAWNSNQVINDNWLQENFGMKFHNDCRLHVLNFLLEKYKTFRK